MVTKSTTSLADQLLEILPRSPGAYPQKLDLIRDAALVVKFDADAYRAASFLDDRILGPDTQGAWLPLDAVREAARSASHLRPLHFIFHTGHVGSTLVSRLLDDVEGVLSLREPMPLRTLADAHDVLCRPESLLSGDRFDAYLATFLTLWRRGYDATRCIVLKATSVAGRMAGPILRSHSESKAIYMNLRAEPYLAALLAGDNSPLDLRGHGPGRIRRLQARVAAPLEPIHAMSLGQLAAMSWLAESWAQHDALTQHHGRVIALDFDRFLANVEECLGIAFAHFGLADDARQLSRLGQSPALARYAKAPEYAYSPANRAAILDRSRHANREEIGKGMAWLERLAQSDGGVAVFLNHAERRNASSVVC
jgi:hypothetical protein